MFAVCVDWHKLSSVPVPTLLMLLHLHQVLHPDRDIILWLDSGPGQPALLLSTELVGAPLPDLLT